MSEYDIGVLGAGPGGYVAAIRAAQLGARVAVIEKDSLGGTCLNRGCIPTKVFLESSKVLSASKRAKEYGLKGEGLSMELAEVVERKDRIVAQLVRGIEGLFKKRNIRLIKGTGRVASPTEIEVVSDSGSTEVVKAKKLILATGSAPSCPPIIPIDGEKVFTSDEILGLRRLPKSIIIVGGGYIGCEFATFFAEAGTAVTIIEMLDAILPRTDGEIVKEMTNVLRRKKVKLLTGTKLEKLEKRKDEISVTLSNGNNLSGDILLCCSGRKPVTNGLGLEKVGLSLEKGFVPVDERCRTAIDGIFAIGDITGKMQLAHFASRQGIVAAEVASGLDSRMKENVCPSAIFTHPEIASVGLTEEEAKEKGLDYTVGKFPFQALGMAHAMAQTRGFVKILGLRQTQEIVGVHIIGPAASILIAEAALAMQLECTVEELASTIHTHPTLSEAMMEAAENWLGHAIHLP